MSLIFSKHPRTLSFYNLIIVLLLRQKTIKIETHSQNILRIVYVQVLTLWYWQYSTLLTCQVFLRYRFLFLFNYFLIQQLYLDLILFLQLLSTDLAYLDLSFFVHVVSLQISYFVVIFYCFKDYFIITDLYLLLHLEDYLKFEP